MTPAKPCDSIPEFVQLLTQRQLNYHRKDGADSPVVSIISSCYNVPKDYLDQTFHTVINQTFQAYEWVITEDCSTHGATVDHLLVLAERNPKIKIVQQPHNQGLGAGRNAAIAKATGKYLYFLDLDDLIEPTCLEKCVLFLEAHPEFSFVSSYAFGFQAEEYWWEHGFHTPSRFIEQNWVTGRLLYRKADFDALGGFEAQKKIDPYADWERWLKAMSHGQKGWTIPDYLEGYRRTTTGMLAEFYRAADEKQSVTSLIQSRYRSFFIENALPDLQWSDLRRPFQTDAFHQRWAIANPIPTAAPGKRVLCWFPHLKEGGADKFNLDLVTALQQRGYALTLVTTLNVEHHWHGQFYQLTPDIFHLPHLLHHEHWLAFARYILQSRQIDVMFLSNAYFPYYLLPFLRQEFPQVAFVDYTHTDDPDWRGGGYPRVSCQFSAFLDCQVVSSKYLANYYRHLKPDLDETLKVCYTNEDPEKWKPDRDQRWQVREQHRIAHNTILILVPARITAQKRPLFLLDIVKQLAGLPIAVMMLGSGDLLEAVQAKVTQLGLDDIVHIVPPVPPEKMVGYYSAADIFLLPSAYEGLSLALYEAMSMQLPVVAADVGGQRELVVPETGVLIPKGAGDRAEADQYVRVLMELIQDGQRRRQLGMAARDRIIRAFPLSSMVDRMEAIFAEALARRPIEPELSPSHLKLYEELLIWVQETMAVDYFWSQSQVLAQELKQMQIWNQSLQGERDMLYAQSQAWLAVVRQNQIELDALHSQLGFPPAPLEQR